MDVIRVLSGQDSPAFSGTGFYGMKAALPWKRREKLRSRRF